MDPMGLPPCLPEDHPLSTTCFVYTSIGEMGPPQVRPAWTQESFIREFRFPNFTAAVDDLSSMNGATQTGKYKLVPYDRWNWGLFITPIL